MFVLGYIRGLNYFAFSRNDGGGAPGKIYESDEIVGSI